MYDTELLAHVYCYDPVTLPFNDLVPVLCYRAACRAGNRVWGNETVMKYLQEGVFHHWVPLKSNLHWKDPMGKPGCDWLGINHYAR